MGISAGIRNDRILHVDDDRSVLDLTAAFLDNELGDPVVETETSPERAAERLESESFDCIISDYDMPEMTGLEFFERTQETAPKVPFVLYTGKGSEEIASRALNVGVTGYFQKGGPDQQRRLANRVEQAIEERRTQAIADRYSTVLDALEYPIYVVDETGCFEFVNEPFVEMVGYDRETVIGSPTSLVKDEAAVAEAESRLGRILSSEGPAVQRFSVDIIPEEGEPIPCQDHMAALPYEGEQFRGSVGILRDISERQARRQELQRYRRMVQAMGDGLYVTDPDGTYAHINDQLAEMIGYDREEIVGSSPDMILDESDIETYEAAIRELLADDERDIATVELDVEGADGEPLPVEVNLTLRPGGEFLGTVGVVRDITARKQRERELTRYETIVRAIPDRVAVLTNDGEVVMANGIAGYDSEEIVGEHFSVVTSEDDVRKAEEVFLDLVSDSERDKATYEHTLVMRDGEEVPHEAHLALIPPGEDGVPTGVVSVLRDISERKQREEELKRTNERLEAFSSLVSHDLRNPLMVARGRLELAQQECDSEHLDAVERSHERMQTLLENLLALAREGEMVSDPEPVSLEELLETSWQTVETGEATLEVRDDVVLSADPTRGKQLVENLLRNAVEHGSTSPDSQARQDAVEHWGSSVTITAGTLDEIEGFYIEDDGPGIPPEKREQVVESGYSDDPDGTGLGLAIVDRIADAHDWSLRVTRSDDGGARFEFHGVDFVSNAPR